MVKILSSNAYINLIVYVYNSYTFLLLRRYENMDTVCHTDAESSCSSQESLQMVDTL